MENDWTKVLGFPGYRVYKQEIDEPHKRLTLWIRRKRGNRGMNCGGCGRRVHKIHEVYEREIRDLPCFEFQTTVVVTVSGGLPRVWGEGGKDAADAQQVALQQTV